MLNVKRFIVAASTAAVLAASPAFAYAEREDVAPDFFVKMCDADKDGLLSKQEVMAQVEKMFDKADSAKSGKLDRKQVEIFLRELMRNPG